VKELVDNLLCAFQKHFASASFPVLQPAIAVGSAFEGWSPCGDHAVYRLLVPLKPPHGYRFQMNLCKTEQKLGYKQVRNFHICVEHECTCRKEQLCENELCFLHCTEEELRQNQGPRLLSSLCTGSYLDVHKGAFWLQRLVKACWPTLPQLANWHLEMLPSRHSCRFQVTSDNEEPWNIELLLGVQQGNSDIFLSSMDTTSAASASTPSTMWVESCAVAEMKFFMHVARLVPHGSCHLKCLCIASLMFSDTGLSEYTIKTVVMHLLTIMPLSCWCSGDLLLRLHDIMRYLHYCMEEKHLNHFFFGNETLPDDIILPLGFQKAQLLNLFQHLVQDPAAYAKA
ncbi:IPIL1 protein, partial [Rhinopomastus cyanomelas]|nr:IPIL1 protein [Rhinopomastus cyanomelas]